MGYADASTKIPSIAWKLAKTNEQKRKLQYLWAQYPEWAYRYAQEVIGKRWPPGEAAIAGSASFAYRYAQDVIRKRWPPGEAAIAGNARVAREYQTEFKVKL
jgi:hypothetical protein